MWRGGEAMGPRATMAATLLLALLVVGCVIWRCTAERDAPVPAYRVSWTERPSMDPEAGGLHSQLLDQAGLDLVIAGEGKGRFIAVWKWEAGGWVLIAADAFRRVKRDWLEHTATIRQEAWDCRLRVDAVTEYKVERERTDGVSPSGVQRSHLKLAINKETRPLPGAWARLVAGEAGVPLSDERSLSADHAGEITVSGIRGTGWWVDVGAPDHCPVRVRIQPGGEVAGGYTDVVLFPGTPVGVAVEVQGEGCSRRAFVSSVPRMVRGVRPLFVRSDSLGRYSILAPSFPDAQMLVVAELETGETANMTIFGVPEDDIRLLVRCTRK